MTKIFVSIGTGFCRRAGACFLYPFIIDTIPLFATYNDIGPSGVLGCACGQWVTMLLYSDMFWRQEIRNHEQAKRRMELIMDRNQTCGLCGQQQQNTLEQESCRRQDSGCRKEKDEQSERSSCQHRGWGLHGYPLSMVYAPMQEFRDLYEPCVGFRRGTIFRELDLPLEAVADGRVTGGCGCRPERRCERRRYDGCRSGCDRSRH